MAEKTVDQKLKECKTIIIQNVEKGVQNAMIYRYLKEQKIEVDVKKYTHNTKDSFITLDFADHEKARAYYDKANFRDKILIRPFNMYFKVELSDTEMKKYYIEGITEDNVRKLFEICRKSGVCKIYTSYSSNLSTAKIKSTGKLSFIRKDPITQQQFNSLKEDLSKVGITISNFIPDKSLKCALLLTDFYKGDLNQSQEVIQKQAKNQIYQLLSKIDNVKITQANITPVLKKQKIVTEGKESPKVIGVKASVDLGDKQSSIKSFEYIRQAFIKLQGRAILSFYSAQTNSYLSLFTNGLEKKQAYKNISDRQFQNILVQEFRKINKDVIQVNVFPTKFGSYVARVYLQDQNSGRQFLVDYNNKKQSLFNFYKSKTNIKFNINVDDKTMKKAKQLQKRVGQITNNIKNQNDRNKMNNNNRNIPSHNVPLPQNFVHGMMQPPIPMNNTMPPMPGQKLPMMMPNSQGFYPPNFGNSIPPMNLQPGNLPPIGGLGQPKPPSNPQQQEREKIQKLLSRKAHFVESCKGDKEHEENVKKQIFGNIRFVLEQDIKVPTTSSSLIGQKILQNNDIGTLIDFLKRPEELYSQVYKQ